MSGLVFENLNEGQARGAVLVSHGLGGLAVMKLLEEHPDLLLSPPPSKEGTPPIRGIVSLCSVPPTGIVLKGFRVVLRLSVRLWLMNYVGIRLQRVCDDLEMCRARFFTGKVGEGPGGPSVVAVVLDADLSRYQSFFRRSSEVPLDWVDFAQQLPIDRATNEGAAPYSRLLPPCLVVGAKRDLIVEWTSLWETASYWGVLLRDIVYVESPHDVMLGREWRSGADAVAAFLA